MIRDEKIPFQTWEKFASECEIIKMQMEYGSAFTGKERYGIITDLSETELEARYPEVLWHYRPYILLSSAFGEARRDFIRNEKKHVMRAARDNYMSIDDDFEKKHPEYTTFSVEEQRLQNDRSRIRMALSVLTEKERTRIIKSFFLGYSASEIAREEGTVRSSVSESIITAKEKLRSYLIQYYHLY